MTAEYAKRIVNVVLQLTLYGPLSPDHQFPRRIDVKWLLPSVTFEDLDTLVNVGILCRQMFNNGTHTWPMYSVGSWVPDDPNKLAHLLCEKHFPSEAPSK